MLMWAGQLSTPAVPGQVIWSPASCDITSSCTRRLVHSVGESSACCKHTYGTDLVCCFWSEHRRWAEKKKEETGNPPLPSTISNSYGPEAWGLNGGGEKRLNEQSERYLLLPPLTWATTVAIGRHPYAGTSRCISGSLPVHCILSRERLELGKRE